MGRVLSVRCLYYVLVLGISFVSGLHQETINYMAKYMEIKYDVIDNFRDSLKTFEAEIAITNTGQETIPGQGWEMYFCHLNLLEPESLPSTEGAILQTYGVKFLHTQGCLFKMVPLQNFGPITFGETRRIRFLSENYSVSKSDGIPNWYIAAPGLEPRVIISTAGESLDFMGEFDKPQKWKRYDYVTDEAEGHDRYDPINPRMRYATNNVVDMKKAEIPLIPTPKEIAIDQADTLRLDTKDWCIVTSRRYNAEARYLAEHLGFAIKSKKPHSRYISFTEADIQFSIKDKNTRRPESYTLSVDPAQGVVEIRARDEAGAFYAVQTLLALIDDQQRLPRVSITDGPRFPYRGVMLDVARNFHTKEHVYKLLDSMAMYKLNKLHLHLTDDEGWRLEIPGLEELTQIGANRCHDPQELTCILPFLGSGPAPTPPGSGFYTVEDYRDILRYATVRHIEVIPEIDMPGHGHAAIKAMEARRQRLLALGNATAAEEYVLVDRNDPSKYKSIQMYTDNAINPCMASTYGFIARVLQTLIDLHRDINPLKTYHFGGDEVAKGAWENSTECSNLFESPFGIIDHKDLKEMFVRQVSNISAQFNVDLAAWEDGVMESGSAPYKRRDLKNTNVYAYAWDNVWEWGVSGRAYKLANAGYKVVMAQATHLYFDHPYEPDPLERGLYWAPRYTNTRKTFGFMPENLYANADVARSGDRLTREDVCGDDEEDCVALENHENIIGIQGHLWSELVRSQEIAEYMIFPRLLALAERAWHEASWESENNNVTRKDSIDRDWQKFANTLGYKELRRLDRNKIGYRVPPPGAVIRNDHLRTNVAYPGLKIEFSVDQGVTWCQAAPDQELHLSKASRILLRTRSADDGRTSRVVSLLAPPTAGTGSVIQVPISLLMILNIINLYSIYM